MPFNGSGVFVRGFSWVNDATNSIPITATRMDSDTNDIVTNGLGLCLTRDGQGSAIANLPMNGFRHTGASNGVASSDYATMGQISPLSPLASPAFTGTPTAPTASPGTNTTQIATTAFVATALTSYLPLSGGSLSGGLTGTGASFSQGVAAGALVSRGNFPYTAGAASGAYIGWNITGPIGETDFVNIGGGAGGFRWYNGNGIASPALIASMDGTGSLNLTGNCNVVGAFFSNGIVQPTIFVQAGTPTARAVGDLWFN